MRIISVFNAYMCSSWPLHDASIIKHKIVIKTASQRSPLSLNRYMKRLTTRKPQKLWGKIKYYSVLCSFIVASHVPMIACSESGQERTITWRSAQMTAWRTPRVDKASACTKGGEFLRFTFSYLYLNDRTTTFDIFIWFILLSFKLKCFIKHTSTWMYWLSVAVHSIFKEYDIILL